MSQSDAKATWGCEVTDRGDSAGLPGPSLEARADDYAELALAPATRRAYRADWRHFAAWCAERDLTPLPASPETLALYLADGAGRFKVSTLDRRLAALAVVHRRAGFAIDLSHPRLSAVWTGIRRAHGGPPATKKALTPDELRAIVRGLPPSLLGCRDRALLVVGFAGSLRRSELVDLDVAEGPDSRGWITVTSEGLLITLRRSKENQTGQEPRDVAVPFGRCPETCAVGAVQAWLTRTGISIGPLFRNIRRGDHLGDHRLSAEDVARRIKAMVALIGLEASAYAGHSLRAGFVTAAARSGASDHAIMTHTRHRDIATMRRYIREATLFDTTPARGIDL